MKSRHLPFLPDQPCSLPMQTPLLTLGYAQWSIDEVTACRAKHDAVLIDIRYTPKTTKPGFSKSDLCDRFGSHYRHVPGFGNVNYEEGPIELAAPNQGIAEVQNFSRALLLMCGCRSPAHCHRTTVADLLSPQFDASPRHLRAPAERAQPRLFDE